MKPARIALPEPTSTSTEYNQRTWPQYAHAVQACGGIAVPVTLGGTQASVARLISGCCGILLPGSPADLNPQKYGQSPAPETALPDFDREAVDELLLQDAFNLRKPIFGICYGLQAVSVWRNGTLRQHVGGDLHEQSTLAVAHRILIEPGSRIASAMVAQCASSSVESSVNSSHHQAIAIPGDGLRIVATAPEDRVIEALELAETSHFVVGVQWHPERTFGVDGLSRGLFQAFVNAAVAWKLQPIRDSVVPATSVA